MLADDIYNVYKLINGNRHQAGRFLVHDGHVRHLEDYYNDIDVPEGAIDDYTIAKLTHPKPGINYASEGDMRAGKHLELIPEHPLVKPMPQPVDVTPEMIEQHITRMPPPVWHYHRAGHDLPHTLEHHGGGKYSLDGNPLSLDELHKIRDNVRTKAATLRYKGAGVADTIAKMERKFENLSKEEEESDMHPAEALREMEAAHAAGHVSAAAVNALRRHIYTDPMTGSVMGNKFAYGEFRKQAKPGIHIAMDGNDFKAINDLYGHEAGDQAIQMFGRAARESMDEAVGQKQGKLFRNPDEQNLYRNGGDEFVAHVPTHEHAAKFARTLRNKLDSLPPIAGQHKLSMSFGFGHDPHSADAALYEAKKQKYLPGPEGAPKQRAFGIGQVPSLAHSAVPGFEGPVPLSPEKLPDIKLPEGMKVEPTQPEEVQAAPTPPPLPSTKTA